MKSSVFQPFSSHGTPGTLIIIWRNQNIVNRINRNFLREPSKELAEPLGSAEHRLKNTDVEVNAGSALACVSQKGVYKKSDSKIVNFLSNCHFIMYCVRQSIFPLVHRLICLTENRTAKCWMQKRKNLVTFGEAKCRPNFLRLLHSALVR